jgi:hypothetical protein
MKNEDTVMQDSFACSKSSECLSNPADSGANRRALLIIGMHRSGTSALARVVNLLGATPPATIMEPGPDNERGFWESTPLVQFHERLLGDLGSDWTDWRAIDPKWQTSDASQAFRTTLSELIESEFGESSTFVSKDPRMCLLLPLWLNTLSSMKIEPVAVLSLRSPSEVAKSLRKRDGFPLERAVVLWLRHMLEAEVATRGLPRAFVHYEALVTDWRAEMTRASSAIGHKWGRSLEEAALEINNFLSVELRHHYVSSDDIARIDQVTPWANQAYEALMTLRSDPHSVTATQLLNHIAIEFQRASSLFAHEVEMRKLAETHSDERFSHLEADFRKVETLAIERLAAFEEERKLREHADEEFARAQAQSGERFGGLEAQLREVEELAMERLAASAAMAEHIQKIENALYRSRKQPLKTFRRFLRWRASQVLLSLSPMLPRPVNQRVQYFCEKNAPLPDRSKPFFLVSRKIIISSAKKNSIEIEKRTKKWSAKIICTSLSIMIRQRWLFSERRIYKFEKSLDKRRFCFAINACTPSLAETLLKEEATQQAVSPDVALLPEPSRDLKPVSHPGGFRAKALSELRPLDEKVRNWMRRPPKRQFKDQKAFSGILQSVLGAGVQEIILSVSHDNYRKVLGGVQLCLMMEEKAYCAREAVYIHLSPLQSLPILAPVASIKEFKFSISVNGMFFGHVSANEVFCVLRELNDVRIKTTLIIHSLLGHAPELISELYLASNAQCSFFWVHDYFGVCPQPTLLRNDVAFCGAPAPQSGSCSICIAGEHRPDHLARFEQLFNTMPFIIVAPSQAALDFWQARSRLPCSGALIHEHCHIKRGKGVTRQSLTSGNHRPLRVGFLGMPALHKGWPIFCEIAHAMYNQPDYSFHHLGKSKGQDAPDGVEFTAVEVSINDWRAMANAVCDHSIDVALLCSLCPETFSFTAHEALAGGALIATFENAGNVPAMVRKHDCGVVFADEQQLVRAFADGIVLREVRRLQQIGLPVREIVFSSMTADLHTITGTKHDSNLLHKHIA